MGHGSSPALAGLPIPTLASLAQSGQSTPNRRSMSRKASAVGLAVVAPEGSSGHGLGPSHASRKGSMEVVPDMDTAPEEAAPEPPLISQVGGFHTLTG